MVMLPQKPLAPERVKRIGALEVPSARSRPPLATVMLIPAARATVTPGSMINVAVFGICGFPTVKDPDVDDGARVELLATIQAPSHGGYYLSFQGLKVAGEREGIIQAVADRITPLTE